MITAHSIKYGFNKCALVRDTCSWVCANSSSVKFVPEKIAGLATKFAYTTFNQFEHHNVSEDPAYSLLSLFILDSLNFCFWPLEGFEYDHLANSVKSYVQQFDGQSKCLDDLSEMNESQLVEKLFKGIKVPLADERARIVREMSAVILSEFQGSVVQIINKANKSAVKLLNILTSSFPNWQDHSVYKGHQIHFLKRPQILIGDIYAKFEGKGYGEFSDIEELTMFPDYRVPQVLNQEGILEYSPELQQKINEKVPIQSGSEQQIQIRAHSVMAVEQIKTYLHGTGKQVKSIQVDWFLWEEGQKNLQTLRPHHRTLTMYY